MSNIHTNSFVTNEKEQKILFPSELSKREKLLLKQEKIVNFQLEKIKKAVNNKRMSRKQEIYYKEQFLLYNRKKLEIQKIKDKYSLT